VASRKNSKTATAHARVSDGT